MTSARTRAGIVITGEDQSAPAFASLRRNLAAAQQQATDVGDRVTGMAGKFGTIGVALAAAFSGASLKGAVDLGDQLDDLSEKSGIAVTELSALRYAGEVTGTPLEALAAGVKKLSTTMTEAAGGAKEQGKLFDAMGISVKNLDGTLKASDQVLGEIADRFASFEDGPAKAALAVKIFGKAGADMIPLLNQGSRGIAELRKEAEQLGAVVGEDFARQSAAFNDNLKKIELNVEGTKRSIAQELLPTLNTLAEAFLETRDGSSSFAEIFGGTLRSALQFASVNIANVSFVLKGVGREIGALAAQAVALATLDLDGFNAISEAVKEDGIRARKELDDLERRILQTGSSLAGAGRGDAPDPRALGPVGSIQEQTRGWRRQAPVIESDDKVSKEISAYERLSKAIGERMALMDKELALGRALTDQEKFETKVLEDLGAAKGKISAAEAARIKSALEESKARALQLDVSRAQLKAAQEEAAERQRLRNQDDQNVKQFLQQQEQAAAQQLASLRDRIAGVQDETAAADLAARANIGLAEAVEQVAIARAQERLERLHDDGDEAQRVRAEIAERQRLIGVLREQRIGEQSREGMKQMQQEGERFFESIYDGLSDSLFRGFEAGKGFFKSFWDGVKNTLKTTVLRVGIQGVMGMTPLAGLAGQGTVGAALGAPGFAQSAAGGAAGSWLFGSSTLGTGLSTTMSNGLISGFGANMANIGNAFAGGEIMLGIGNALPYLGVALAAISMLSGAFKGETRSGGQYRYTDGAANFFSGPSGGDPGGAQVKAGIEATVAAINQTLASLGSATTVTGFQAGYESSGKGRGGVYSGGMLSSGRAFGESGIGSNYEGTLFEKTSTQSPSTEEALKNFSTDLKQATIQALQAADVPGVIGDYLRSLGDVEALSDGALDAALGRVNKALSEKATLEERYFELTHTQEEVLARNRQRERDAVDESNRALYDQVAALEAQKRLTGEAAAASVTLAAALEALRHPLRTVDDIARSIFDLEREGQSLRVGLLRAQGDDAGARAMQRALDTAGFTEAELAAYDYNQALRDQAQAMTQAREAADRARSEAAGLQQQLDELLGNSAALRRRELDALDASNRALQERIWRISDARADTDAAYRAVERAVNAQRVGAQIAADLAQEQVSTLRSLFDLLKNEVRSLYGEVTDTAAMSAVAGQQFIQQALENYRATGYLPEESALADAITSVRGALQQSNYGSRIDFDRDRLVLAGKLGELRDASSGQLSIAERQLQAAQEQVEELDRILDAAREQVDVLRGIETGVGSVREALERFAAALAREAANTGARLAPTEQWVALPNGQGQVWQSAGGAVAVANSSGAFINTKDGMTFGADQVRTWVTDQLAIGDALAVYEAAVAKGISANSLDKLMGWVDGTSNEWARNVGLPQFDVGANRIPQDMLAFLHKDEAVIPAPFNPWAGGAGFDMPGNAAVLAALQAVVERLDRIEGNTGGAAVAGRKTADVLTRVTRDGNALLTEAA